LATPAAASAIPVKPRTAAINATTKKITAQRNIIASSESLKIRNKRELGSLIPTREVCVQLLAFCGTQLAKAIQRTIYF
jgi:hypothetical protein